MGVLKHLKNFIMDSDERFIILNMLTFFKKMDSETYLKKRYKARLKRYPDLDNPLTYSEKCQWLKLRDFRAKYTAMADKYAAKEYVGNIIGREHIIPLLGVWDSLSQVDFDSLPASFVLKCNHDSGGYLIVKDKNAISRAELMLRAYLKLGWRMKRNFYYVGRELAYKDIKPRIIAEKYMEEFAGQDVGDYKLFCFNGKARLIMTVHGGHADEGKTVRTMYDTDWNVLNVGIHGKPANMVAEKKPKKLKQLIEYAERLSDGMAHLRVDFYLVGDDIYFGELTFFHQDGLEYFTPESFDRTLGDMLDLSDVPKERLQ